MTNDTNSNVIQVKFGKRSKPAPLTGNDKMKIQRLKNDAFDIELNRLVEQGFITHDDANQLLQLLRPARKLVPWVNKKFVEAAEDFEQIEDIAQDESKRRTVALDNKSVYFRELDFRKMYELFLLDPIKHPAKITSINGETEVITVPYLNPELAHLLPYFFYLLRILRQQNTKNYKDTAPQEAKADAKKMRPWIIRWLDRLVNFQSKE